MIMMIGIKRRLFPFWSIMMILMCLTTRPSKVHCSLEAKGTPSSSSSNEELTNHQREQLVLLDQHISSSPNPTETLQQIAESNNMSAVELKQLLESARQKSAVNSSSSTVPSVVSKFVSSVFLFLFRLAKVHPKQFYVCILALISIYYISYNIPRNGLIISTGSSTILFPSHGRTTFCKPPRTFILSSLFIEQSKVANNKKEKNLTPSILSQKFNVTKMPLNQVTTKKNYKNMKYSITSRTVIPIPTDDFLMQQLKSEGNNKTMDKLEDEALQYTWIAASSIMNSRRFAEYVFETATNKKGKTAFDISFHTTKNEITRKEKDKEEVAALIAKGMGDFGRYGIQPLRLALYKDTTVTKMNDMHKDDLDEASPSSFFIVVAYSTLPGGHWDGELCITVDAIQKDETPTQLVVSVSILVPKEGGRMLRSAKLSTQLVTALSESICHSIVVETQRIAAQNYRRQTFLQKTHGLAREKQHSRYENAKKLEEMQENRRRRRNHGNGGYRPGGPRVRHGTQQTKFMM